MVDDAGAEARLSGADAVAVLRRDLGPAALHARCLALAMRDGLRETDSIGPLGPTGYAVLMPGCTVANGRVRV